MRTRYVSLTLTAILGGVLLTGCTQTSHVDSCVPVLSSGALSENIEVSGGFDAAPDVTVPQGITFGNPQVSYVERATDRSKSVTEPSVVTVNYALVESFTGSVIEESDGFGTGAGASFVPVRPGEQQGAFLDSLECTAPGDRIVAVLSPEEAQAIAGSLGAPPETALALLVDVHDVQPVHVSGSTRPLPFGFPGVVTNETGQPGVVVTPEPAPTEVRVAARIKGDGAEVQATDDIVANTLEVSWAGQLIDNAWPNGPTFIGNEENPLVPIREHLTGQTVGSQVIVLVPTQDGDASVHVVDILAAG